MSPIKKVVCLVLLSTGLFIGVQASAANACDNAYTQTDMNKCAAAKLTVEDQKLNQSYRDLQRLLNNADKEQLKMVQLAWIDFRDKTCQFSASSSRGGSVHPMVLNYCLANYTQQRRVQLEADIQNMVR